jgi:hypothetical protein
VQPFSRRRLILALLVAVALTTALSALWIRGESRATRPPPNWTSL